MIKIKQIDPRIERNRILLELYDYIENNTNYPAASICINLYRNLDKRVRCRKDFIKFFSDDSNLVVNVGEKSLKVIREFFGITEVTSKLKILEDFEDDEKGKFKKELLSDIRKYLDEKYPDYKFNNAICNAVGRALNSYDISSKEELKNLIYKSDIVVRGIGLKYKDRLIDYFYN